MEIAKYLFLVLQALVSLALIIIVALQTTKNEGLTGSIGGQMTPSFKGMPGAEEQVRTWTVYVSAAWFILSMIVAVLWIKS